MTLVRLKLPFRNRRRPRAPRAGDEHCAVFRTFVHVLARICAQNKSAEPEKPR